MSDQRPQGWGQPSPNPPDQTLLPPSSIEGMGPQPAWTPPAPPAPHSIWNRIAAYVVLVAVVAAAAGAGIGWSLARAINTHQVAQSTTPTPSPNTPTTPITPAPPGTGSSYAPSAPTAAKGRPAIAGINTTHGTN